MKILITGAGGFVGRFLFESFLAKGNHVVATYRNTKPCISDISSAGISKVVRIDLSESLRDLEPVDVVIHTAAVHPNSRPTPTIDDYLRSNILGTRSLADYAKATRPRLFIYLSTISVYGEIGVSELDENAPLNKPDMYGSTKYMGELLLREQVSHFSSICIRLPGVVGAGYFTPWVGSVLRKASRNEPISIYNPSSMFNNVVDLPELWRFISWIIDRGFAGFDFVNLAAAEPIRIREVIELIVSLTGSKSRIQEQDTDKQSFSIKLDKIKRIFGFESDTTKAIIHRYVTENVPILNHQE